MPAQQFVDRGKGAIIVPPDVEDAIKKAVTTVTKAGTKQRKREERDARAVLRRDMTTRRNHQKWNVCDG